MESSADDISKEIRKTYAHLIRKGKVDDFMRVADVAEIVKAFLDGKKSKTQHWGALCKAYNEWYKDKFGFSPDFKGSEIAGMKMLVTKIKKVADENKIEWTEKIAIMYLLKFLNLAYEDKWLKDNFLMKNINSQYSKIRANGRAKQDGGNKKIGRITTKQIEEFLDE